MNYTTIASKEVLEKTMNALSERGHLPELFETKEQALERIKELIPQGASVMNGSSRSLEEIGLVNYLKDGQHGWNNLHDGVLAETDPERQALLRKQSVLSDFYLGSVHAVTESGELLIASNSGSQLPHLDYTSPNLILVIGAQKIVPNIDDAFTRLNEHVIPLEDKRMQEAMGMGTYPAKILIVNREQEFMGRKSHIIFVNEDLGF